jgi:chaperonin cofactor prefoldin
MASHIPGLISPETKENIIKSLQEDLIFYEKKLKVYNDLLDHCAEMNDSHFSLSEYDALPKKEDIIRIIGFFLTKYGNKKKFHKRLLEVAQDLPTTTEDNHDEGDSSDEDLRGRHSMTAEERKHESDE